MSGCAVSQAGGAITFWSSVGLTVMGGLQACLVRWGSFLARRTIDSAMGVKHEAWKGIQRCFHRSPVNPSVIWAARATSRRGA